MSVERYKPHVVIKALQQTRGIKARAAEILGCTRWTVDAYCKRYPEIMRAYLEEKERLLDSSEDAFYNIIEDSQHRSHWDAVRFHLATQGRDRGYGDSDVTLQQLREQLGEITDIDMSRYTTAQLQQLKQLLMIGAGEDQPMTSDAVNARDAVRAVRDMDDENQIRQYTEGDQRVTVRRAAEARINAITEK